MAESTREKLTMTGREIDNVLRIVSNPPSLKQIEREHLENIKRLEKEYENPGKELRRLDKIAGR